MRLPDLRFAAGARRKRVTGSHIYGHMSCEHRVRLDFFEDPGRALPMSGSLERLLERGRDFEDLLMQDLGYPEPDFEAPDFEAGAAQTLALMQQARPGIAQAVLFEAPWLGIPDLLRRESGNSRFGEYHYVVGDIKSSWRSRSDQAMQVAFYSRLLARLQDRQPEYGYLILRSGEEERIDISGLDPILDLVLDEVAAMARGESRTRPQRNDHCSSCRWRELCAEEDPMGWLPGLTRSTRELLAQAGLLRPEQLFEAHAEQRAREAGVARASFLRAVQVARAVREGRALPLRGLRDPGVLHDFCAVWIGRDGFDDRSLLFASQREGRPAKLSFARDRAEEESAMAALIEEFLEGELTVVHGPEFPSLLASFASRMPEWLPRIQRVENRLLAACSLLRGAHAFPAPVVAASELAAWLDGEAPSEELSEQRALLAQLLAGEDYATMEQLAEAELAGLLRLGALLRDRRRS
ncbi:MAG: hypothetical protein CSA62_08220 [Planctomycetota bacterium]|nr:MAG: hypothetical protein CSA62_08220 [Planctomycetota bacterium]